jgi:hypothetical protein
MRHWPAPRSTSIVGVLGIRSCFNIHFTPMKTLLTYILLLAYQRRHPASLSHLIAEISSPWTTSRAYAAITLKLSNFRGGKVRVQVGLVKSILGAGIVVSIRRIRVLSFHSRRHRCQEGNVYVCKTPALPSLLVLYPKSFYFVRDLSHARHLARVVLPSSLYLQSLLSTPSAHRPIPRASSSRLHTLYSTSPPHHTQTQSTPPHCPTVQLPSCPPESFHSP